MDINLSQCLARKTMKKADMSGGGGGGGGSILYLGTSVAFILPITCAAVGDDVMHENCSLSEIAQSSKGLTLPCDTNHPIISSEGVSSAMATPYR